MKIIKKIEAVTGPGNVLTSLEDRICYSYDATGQKFLPDLIVKPGSTAEVAEIIKIAHTEKIPIIPRGAGSGFVGGSLPINGGMVLLTSRLNKIIEIDQDNFIVITEPGVITETLQKEVLKYGLFYPPDPSSARISTIGGNVAQCAGGPHGIKYGVTKDYCIGLEVVLPNGEILKTGVKTLKGVVGYDLTKLIIGSEGTLGFITKIIMKLIPQPEAVKTLFATFPTIDQAGQAVVEILKNKVIPASIEFIDQLTLNCVQKYLKVNLIPGACAYLLIELDGNTHTVAAEAAKTIDVCRKIGAVEINLAQNEEERESLWKLRKSISPALRQLNPSKINEDITVPRSNLPAMLRKLEEIGKRHNLIIANFGHAGDGNIHVNLMINREDEKEKLAAQKAVEEIFQATLDLEGTISGEHGVGITKKFFVEKELGPTGLELMRQIKKVFDPQNIMNPGKIF